MKYIAIIMSVVICTVAICLRFWLTKQHFDRLDERLHQHITGKLMEDDIPKEKHNLASILIGTVLIVLIICLLALFMSIM